MDARLIKYGCLAVIVVVAIGCRKVRYEPDPSDAPSGAPLVTVIYDPGALGDRSYNDLIYAGVERAALSHGLRTMQFSPSTLQDGLAILETCLEQMHMQRDTVRRLLVVAGLTYEDYLRQNSDLLKENPLSDLLFLETMEPLTGKGSTVCLPYYGAMYEAGAVSCAFSDRVLLVAANPVMPSIVESVKGFTEGFNADYIPPDEGKELQTEWLSDEAGGGFVIGDEEAMRIIFNGGQHAVVPLVFPLCGGASTAFYRLGDLFGGFDYIGVDAAGISPRCPFSVVKHIDRAMDLCIGQWLSSAGMPKHQTLTFADGWTEMVLHPYTEMQKAIAEQLLTEQLLDTIRKDAVMKEETAYE